MACVARAREVRRVIPRENSWRWVLPIGRLLVGIVKV